MLNQIKNSQGSPVSAENLYAYRQGIYSLTIHETLVNILRAMPNLGISFRSTERDSDAGKVFEVIQRLHETESFSQDLLTAMKRLWSDDGVQECFKRSAAYRANSSAKYFLDNLERLRMIDYQPTEQDVLATRIRKTVEEVSYSFKNLNIKLFYVNDHFSKRSKFMHCFEDVTALVFCVSLSEYDQVHETGKKLHESLLLFDSICNSRWLEDTSIILLLQDRDVFEEKIKSIPLNICFPDYRGPLGCGGEAAAYIQSQFEARNKSEKKEIYTHITYDSATTNTQFIYDAVTDVIIANNLRGVENGWRATPGYGERGRRRRRFSRFWRRQT